MAQVHRLSKQDARRIAVCAQLLTAERPADLLETVGHLTTLQLDPVAAVAPAADLVAWTRLGDKYHPDHLKKAIEDRRLIELRAFLRPAEDLALYRAKMAAWPGPGQLRDWQVHHRDWVAANDRCRRDILARLRAEGPVASRDLPDTCDRPWESSGWTNNKNVVRLLDFMASRGEVAVAGRRGTERLWDLAECVFPDDPVVPLEDAARETDRRLLRSLGISRVTGPESMFTSGGAGTPGEPAVVEGVKGTWHVDPSYLDSATLGGSFAGRAALLSPFDRLIYLRRRSLDLFDFDYLLEMYKPVAKRRWGYYALPILYGDQMIGKLDAAADRKNGVFTVNAIHRDVGFTPDVAAAVDAEIASLAARLQLDLNRGSCLAWRHA